MNKSILSTLITAGYLLILLNGCDVDSTNSSATASSAVTGIVSHRDFTIRFDPDFVSVFSSEGFNGAEEVSVIIRANGINEQLVEGQVVNIRTEWGTFSDSADSFDNPDATSSTNKGSCVLTNGSCAVKWLPGDKLFAPSVIPAPATSAECIVAFTAWTRGEEKFGDINGNGLFDSGETHFDLPEPYLDIDESGIYISSLADWNTGWGTAGVDPGFCNADFKCEMIDTNGDGIHNPGDGKYNGSSCGTSASCSTTTSTFIWTTSYLLIGDEFDHDNDFGDITPEQLFCGGFKGS